MTFHWTPEALGRLRALVQDGVLTVTLADAAMEIGCGTATVYQKLIALGFRPRTSRQHFWTREKSARLASMLGSMGTLDRPAEDAARALRCGLRTLSRKLQKVRDRAAKRQGRN